MGTPHGTPWKRLGDGSLLTQDADEGLGHIVEFKSYLNILLALLVLTIVTVAASRIDFGNFNKLVALGIASVKAYLVATTFMHLKFEKPLIIAYAIYPLVLLALMIGGTLGDEMDRKETIPERYKVESIRHDLLPGAEHGATHGKTQGTEEKVVH